MPSRDRQIGILGQRSMFSMVYRLAVRLVIGMESRSGLRSSKLGLLASSLADFGLAGVLQRTERPFFVPRLVVDSIDTAIWGQKEPGSVELSVLTGVPLAMESGYRYGAFGLLVPASTALVTNGVRIMRKKSVTLAPFRWQVLGAVFGVAMAMLETRHRDEVVERAEQEGQARVYRAWLGGQNDVAMGADTVVDDLCRISPLLGNEVTDKAIGPMVHAWKQALATSTELGAVYLGNALAQWHRRHNDFQPDLSADVWFDYSTGQGTRILTARQAEWLSDALDQMSLTGQVRIEIESLAAGQRPGMELVMVVGTHRITIPSDDEQTISPLDVGPIGLALGAFWAFDTTTSNHARCSRAVIWPLAGAHALGSVWAQRQVSARSDGSHGDIVTLASAASISMAALSSLTVRRLRDTDGRQLLPFFSSATVVAMMLPLYWRDLDGDQRRGVMSALLATVGLGVWLFPEEIEVSDFARELLWIGTSAWTTARLRRSLDHSADFLRDSLRKRSLQAEQGAFAEGRSFVIQLVSEARYALRRQIAGSDGLDSRVSEEAGRRLDAVDQRIERLTV